MGFGKFLLVGGVLVGGYYAVKAYNTSSAADKLQSSVSEVDFKGVTMVGFNPVLKAELKLKHTNPTGTAITVKNVFLDMLTPSGAILATIRQPDTSFTVAPNSDSIHTLKMTSTGLDVAGELLSIMTGGNLPDKVIIKGYITANGFKVNYNEEYALNF